MDQKKRETWLISVLYMAGLNAGEIASGKFMRLGSDKASVKTVTRTVRELGLDIIRVSDQRAKHLARLAESAPDGLERVVDRVLAKLAVQATAKLRSGVEHPALMVELKRRVLLPRDVDAAIAGMRQVGSVPPDATREVVGDRKSTVKRNILASPIEWLFARGRIPQWAYDAANRLSSDWTKAEIGGFSAFDPSKDIVDHSGVSVGMADSKLDAIQRVGRVIEALAQGYGNDVHREKMRKTVFKYAVEESAGRAWIGRIREPIVPVLIEGLEHVAFIYGLAPNGEVARHLDMVVRNNGGRINRPREAA